MNLIEKIHIKLEKSYEDVSNTSFNSLAESDSNVRKVTADILNVPYISSKEEFEDKYVADFIKNDDENDEQYQQRLSKLNENRFIIAINKHTEKRILFTIDPTKPEMDNYLNMEYGIIEYETYKAIVGISNDLSISFDEDEPLPVYIRRLFRFAHEEKSTDIDFTSMHASVSIKLKVSGEWNKPIGTFPIAYKNLFMTALCSMATPNAVDYRSGKELKFRVAVNIEGVDIAYRVSIIPTAFGENVAMRKLPGVAEFPKLEELGLTDEAVAFVKSLVEQIDSPKKGGVVFITGETGSGKSTLLSAVEREYLAKRKKVSTSEDPVENKHPHPFLNQTEVGEDAGITHMDALAGFLRQNSDVIVIGECRRTDELLAVINAGLSGHYAYTTMHTGSVEETLLRLETMNVDLNMLSGILKGVINTTLIPRLCPHCKVQVRDSYYKRGEGCDHCKGKGTKGVIPVGEYAKFDKTTKSMIGNKKPHEIIDHIENGENYISMTSQVDYLKYIGLIDTEAINV